MHPCCRLSELCSSSAESDKASGLPNTLQCVVFAGFIVIQRSVRNSLTDIYASETLFVVRSKPAGELLLGLKAARWNGELPACRPERRLVMDTGRKRAAETASVPLEGQPRLASWKPVPASGHLCTPTVAI
jgi:hypothetical protein